MVAKKLMYEVFAGQLEQYGRMHDETLWTLQNLASGLKADRTIGRSETLSLIDALWNAPVSHFKNQMLE